VKTFNNGSDPIALWHEAYPALWRATVGAPEELTPFGAAAGSPNTAALADLPEAEFPFAADEVRSRRVHGKLHLAFPLGPDEEIYGMGLTYRNLNQLHQVKNLRMGHYNGQEDGRTHAPMAFYISSAGYGVLLNTARRVQVYVGTTHPREAPPPLQDRLQPSWRPTQPGRTVDLYLDTPGVEILILGGPAMLDVVRRYNLLCGGGCLPPKWGLGFWHRAHIAASAQECVDLVDHYREQEIPLSVLGLEPGWHSGCYPCTHDWRPSLFPEPRRFIADLAARQVRVNLWQNLFIHPDCALGEALAPYCCSHTGSWGGLIPDVTLPQAREVLQEHFKREHVDLGVSGYKHDEVDDEHWLFPLFATFPSGADAEELHSLLGLYVQRLSFELFRAVNRRTYGLVRGSNLGAAYLPYALYNDCYEHREYITGLCSASLGGLLWCPEARTSNSAEEWLRRIQAVCFAPLAMLNAWASDQMPWSFPEVAAAVREVIVLRHRLIPYLYSAFADYAFQGVPPIRAMLLEPGFSAQPVVGGAARRDLHGTDNPYAHPESRDVSDQFMFGASILVAPFFAGQAERRVLLPPGRWFDFYTGAEVVGPWHTVRSDLGPVPLFVKDGGIVPLLAEGEDLQAFIHWRSLEVRHYGEAEGVFCLYDDDGETFAYEQGDWSRVELSAQRDGSGRWRGVVTRLTSGERETLPLCDWRFM
jgi:alpha-glucosidase (family GH31 glycosyl hydrolase)